MSEPPRTAPIRTSHSEGRLWRFAPFFSAIAIAAQFAILNQVAADDWPQWRGPRRDATSAETGLLPSWPPGGPQLLWKASGLGTGYAGVVIGHGRAFSMGRQGSDVVVTALEADTGKLIWQRKIGETARHPCSTPTLDGELLYALDPDGELVCLQVMSGEIVWQKSFVDEFAGQMMSGRGYGESPLIDGDRLICTPGGADAALVALDKHTGAVVWKTRLPELGPGGRDGAGFSSVIMTEAAGRRQYVQLVGRGVVGIDARDGRFLWGYNPIANGTANIPTPVVHNEFVFVANGYTAGSVLLKLVSEEAPDGGPTGIKAEVVYTLSVGQFQNHHGGVVRLGNYLYGGHGNNNGLPTCLEFETGRVVWKRRGPGVGSAAVVSAGGQLYFRYQNGVVALIEASSAGYVLQGTLEIPGAGGDSWAHPAIANGRLYLREQETLWVYDLRDRTKATNADTAVKSAQFSSESLAALRKLGISAEPLRMPAITREPRARGEPGRRLYEYVVDRTAKQPAQPPLVVTITDAHLTPRGEVGAELRDRLNEVAAPLVVNLAGTKITDAGLESLAQLNIYGLNLELCGQVTDDGLKSWEKNSSLRLLILSGTGVSHAGLHHLAANSNLVALDLELCDGITDDACEVLGGMRQLKSLVLKKSGFEPRRISNDGLERLRGLVDLEVLNLYGNSVTDAGLTHLQPLQKLRQLNLSLLPITDAGLAHLQPLTALERLDLLYSEGFAGPTLTDAGMQSLEPLTNLTALNLTGSKLTGTGLTHLYKLTQLQSLQLVRTRVSDDEAQTFQKAVPKCEISR